VQGETEKKRGQRQGWRVYRHAEACFCTVRVMRVFSVLPRACRHFCDPTDTSSDLAGLSEKSGIEVIRFHSGLQYLKNGE